MLKSCKYCGRIHDSKFDCGRRPPKKKRLTDVDRFRWTSAWQQKREAIKARDHYLCQVCRREFPARFTFDGLQVHHAVPLEEDYDRRLDDDNLITLCERHHEMAEAGEIPREEIQRIIREQEGQEAGPGIPPGEPPGNF